MIEIATPAWMLAMTQEEHEWWEMRLGALCSAAATAGARGSGRSQWGQFRHRPSRVRAGISTPAEVAARDPHPSWRARDQPDGADR
jgi:hypothetical protein